MGPGLLTGRGPQVGKDLRDPATYADLSRASRVLLDPDVEGDLPRIEQAAYDVLFNKRR
jgi:hypothetical protein